MRSMGEILPASARRFGDKVALVCDGRSYTYDELNRLTNRCANGLAGLGISAGDRVTIYGANSAEWIVGYHGAAKLGAVVNPINVMLTPKEVAFVTKDCGAKAILVAGDKLDGFLDVAEETPVEHIVAFADAVPQGIRRFRDLLDAADDTFDPVEVDLNAVGSIGYTSGTTGHPKGAMQSHRALIANNALTATMHVKTALDTVVTALPLPHVYGNVVVNGAFMTGMTAIVMPRFEEKAALEAIQGYRATMFEGVPTMYQYLLNYPGFDGYDLSSLTRCTVGGQTMPVAKMEEVEARFGVPLIELWGMTELAGLGTTFPAYGEIRHGSIGVALPTVECRILDVEPQHTERPNGEVGELAIKGPIVMLGYYGNEAGTREVLSEDGWLLTGDLAEKDADGYIYIVDRRKDMIVTAGNNVYPAEIERVLAKHPAVAMVAVGKLPDETKGEIAKAYVVLKHGAKGADDPVALAQEMTAFCRQELAAYKAPRAVQFVADLPKTSTGKILRRELHTLDA